jgi:hypothetical protein
MSLAFSCSGSQTEAKRTAERVAASPASRRALLGKLAVAPERLDIVSAGDILARYRVLLGKLVAPAAMGKLAGVSESGGVAGVVAAGRLGGVR